MSLFSASNLSALPQLALVLGVMVLVHEFGHFAVAKLCGVRVEAFAIGFGKRLFGFIHNGTDYRLNLIPLGGYVKMAGELGGDGTVSTTDRAATRSSDPGEYQNHPRWQRTLITLAGPIANFLLALGIMTGVYMTHNEIQAFYTQPPVADYVSPGSPVARTGLQPGDRIVHFDSIENPTWEDLEQRAGLNFNQTTPFSFIHNGRRVDSTLFVENKGREDEFDFNKLGVVPVEQPSTVQVLRLPDASSPAARAGFQPKDHILSIDNIHPHSVDAVLAYLQDHGGKPVSVLLERVDAAGRTVEVPVSLTPVYTDTKRGDSIIKAWLMGFNPVQVPVVIGRLPFAEAAVASWHDNVKNSRLIFEVLHRLFTHQVSVKALQSPIGIGVQVHEAFQMSGYYPILALTAMISLNLGIFNLLPIPILDGGMIVFLFIESLLRRDLNQQVKERVYQVAFVCLILFAAMVIFNDLTRYLPGHLKT